MDTAKYILDVLSRKFLQTLALFLFIGLSFPAVFAQMGPPIGPATLLNLEHVRSDSGNRDGVNHQSMVSTGFPVLKSDQFFLLATLNYQNIQLQAPADALVPETGFQALNLALNGTVEQESGNGWIFGTTIGSASDEIFANSDVFTYNLNIQRKNKLSDKTSLLYGFFYSNNAAVLPGLPIPTLTYEISDKESGDLFRIGFPIIIRQNDILPQTQWGLFAIGPVLWDLFLKNSSIAQMPITVGIQKRPDTFLLSEPIPSSPLSQLMIEHIASYALIEWQGFKQFSVGLKLAYNFNNHFRLRETGTTRDDFDLNRRFSDYAFFGLNIKIWAPIKTP